MKTMKKTISFFLALIMVCSCFAFHSPDANALGAVWVKEFYKDKFGDKTEQYYLTNKSQFKGTYNSDSVTKGKLGANLIFERDGESLLAYVTLSLKGKDQVKNGTSANQNYDIAVKKPDGSEFTTSAVMQAGEDRMLVQDALEFMRLITSGDISIYIEQKERKNSNYLFQVKRGNFEELFNQEIWIPYQEARYQKAEELLNKKQYDEASEAFKTLGDYKDSSARAEEAIEAKKAGAYAKAESLLAEKQYDEAISILRNLGEYKDSSTLLENAEKDRLEYEYETAVLLFNDGKLGEAGAKFTSLGDYKDSAERLVECQKAAAFEEAIVRLDQADYKAAFELFSSLGDYDCAQDYVKRFYHYIVKSETKNNMSYDKDVTGISKYEYSFDKYGRISTCEIETQEGFLGIKSEYKTTEEYIYEDNGLLSKIVTKERGKTRTKNIEYDSDGKIIYNDEMPGYTVTRNDEGRIIKADFVGENRDHTIRYEYDQYGNCVRETRDYHVNEQIYKDSITVYTYAIGYNSLYLNEEQVVAIIAQKNADAYAEAEELLQKKQYDEAIEAFLALGEYSDSAERVEKVTEEKNANAYTEAETLLQKKQYDEAIEAFLKLGNYRDSTERVESAKKLKIEAAYQKALELVSFGQYEEAYHIFIEIEDYKDVSSLLANDPNLAATAADIERKEKIKLFKTTGNRVLFGSYEQDGDRTNGSEKIEWIVLYNEGDKSLLISKYILDRQPYNNKDMSITWENCTLRKWLNSTFFREAFNKEEQNAILSVTIDESEEQWFGKDVPGGNNTVDKVFLLSCGEKETYFKTYSDARCSLTPYAKSTFGSYNLDSNVFPWWLRSPGRFKHYAMLVDREYGAFEDDIVTDNYGVRPALWIDLEKLVF